MQFKKYYKFNLENAIWRVKETFKIKWQADGESYGYTITNKGVKRYLELFQNNQQQLTCWLYQREDHRHFLSLRDSEKTLTLGKYTFPKEIHYHNTHYIFKRKDNGKSFSSYFEYETVSFLHYECSESNQLLVIEIWNRDELEVYTGVKLEHGEVTPTTSTFLDVLRSYLRV